jgi:hypothetical protein
MGQAEPGSAAMLVSLGITLDQYCYARAGLQQIVSAITTTRMGNEL